MFYVQTNLKFVRSLPALESIIFQSLILGKISDQNCKCNESLDEAHQKDTTDFHKLSIVDSNSTVCMASGGK
jgi:hypothetical protein